MARNAIKKKLIPEVKMSEKGADPALVSTPFDLRKESKCMSQNEGRFIPPLRHFEIRNSFLYQAVP